MLGLHNFNFIDGIKENSLVLQVLDEDVASPAELAKAYMGSRPSKVSVSMFGLHNQVPRGDSALLSNKILPSKSPIMSLVPRSSGQFGSFGNGFLTPRSRGRYAIYSMARTPYSKVNSASVLKVHMLDNHFLFYNCFLLYFLF